ncbi:MAG: UDP-N-acetylmuramate--L-alanine ligase [Acidimicrobiales bacterium]|nr:UDP-N-acetylmuramate--L-alanine ligase [Acidimicrobiales bacterium]
MSGSTIDLAAVEVDLGRPRRIHIVGVGGAGMCAIAEILASLGHRVTGSDLKDGPTVERLRALGLAVAIGHDAANVGDAELVAISTAIPAHNPEVRAANAAGVTVLRRADILAALCRLRATVAVAGTHGKTTTSSMLALILVEAGLRPSFLIGGDLNEIGTGAAWDDGAHFVVEADESDGTFLVLGPKASVVTNVEADHLDHYGSYDAVRAAFARFVTTTDGPAVVGIDGPDGAALADAARADNPRLVTFGAHAAADYRIVDAVSQRSGVTWRLQRRGEDLGELALPIVGLHNAANATAAAACALELGAPFDACRRALGRFAGVARRLQFRGEAGGVTFIDDYAHLPTEVGAALAAVRSAGWPRIVAVFQPHRYSRIAEVGGQFGDSFVDADLIAVTDVYAAGERPRPGVSGRLVANAALDAHPWRPLAYLPHRRDVVTWLLATLRPGDVCVTLGAGDLTALPDEIQARLAARGEADGPIAPAAPGSDR